HQRGLAAEPTAGIESEFGVQSLFVQATAAAGAALDPIERALDEAVAALVREPLGAAELGAAVEALEAERLLEIDGLEDRASRLLRYADHLGRADGRQEEHDRLRRVTP